MSKRLLGFLSWQRKRRKQHLPDIIDSLLKDLAEQQPDHLGLTGDIVNLGLAAECAQAAPLLAKLADIAPLSMVPGNHDAYQPDSAAAMEQHWAPWLPPYFPSHVDLDHVDFGHFRLILLSTGCPTPVASAQGMLGTDQLTALESLLPATHREGRCSIILLHHPPVAGLMQYRKALRDQADFAAILAHWGAGLILHGHRHQPCLHYLPGPDTNKQGLGAIPVIGAGSASLWHADLQKAAHYHLLKLDKGHFQLHHRRYQADSKSFIPAGEQQLNYGPMAG